VDPITIAGSPFYKKLARQFWTSPTLSRESWINAAGHQIVFRAPYYPVDGLIEFVFNTIEQALGSYLYTVRTDVELVEAVNTVIGQIETFVPYFVNCGYA
jgi:hypothetical protein